MYLCCIGGRFLINQCCLHVFALPSFSLRKEGGVGYSRHWLRAVGYPNLPGHVTRGEDFCLFLPDIVDMSKISADQRRRLKELAAAMSDEGKRQRTPPRFADDYDRTRPADDSFRPPPLPSSFRRPGVTFGAI